MATGFLTGALRSINVPQVRLELKRLVDLGNVSAAADERVAHDSRRLLALVLLRFARHVDPGVQLVAAHAARVGVVASGGSLVGLLGLLLTTLGKSPRSREIFAVPRVVFLQVFAPVRIDHDHTAALARPGLGLTSLDLLLLLLLLLLGWVVVITRRASTGNGLAGARTAVTLGHHYAINPVELDLVLLVHLVEVEAA